MKFLTGLLLAALLGASAARAEVPSIITSGFDSYKASGSKGALAIWLRGAQPALNNAVRIGLPVLDNGSGAEPTDTFGPMESYEVLATFSPSARIRRVYAVAYFPQGPLFCRFDLFKMSGSWTTYDLKFGTAADDILPADVIEKQG
jgi:hypothetical protein